MTAMDYESIYRRAARQELDLPPGWEIGGPQPIVMDLLDQLTGDVLDAGCGTGEHTLFLAAHDREVTGVDSSLTAIDTARAKAEERALTQARFLHADARYDLGGRKRYDTAIDCGLLHSLAGEDRRSYVRTLAMALRSGGRAYIMCFSDQEPPGWGPYRIGADELHADLGDEWHQIDLRPSTLTAWRPDTQALGLVHAWLIVLENR